MNEIICPHCKKAFKIDEAGFADILRQVRDHKFEEELHERLELLEKDKESAIKLAEANITNTLQKDFAKKDAELAEIKSKINNIELEKKLPSPKQSSAVPINHPAASGRGMTGA